MNNQFILLSVIAYTVTLIATAAVKRIAIQKRILDDPTGSSRKIHKEPIPLMGGVGIYLGFSIALVSAIALGILPGTSVSLKNLIGILIGGFWLVLGGVLDDKYTFAPKKQIIWPILAVLTVIVSGIGIESISNPAGGQWFFNEIEFVLFSWAGIPYKITLLADLFTFAWLMAMIYALKFFDGLDGLVSGVTVIGGLVVYFTSLLPYVSQSDSGLLALLVASSFGAFLAFNFHPAKMFLGESGSTLAGFLIGSLAIITEGKIVTTLVIMSLPVLDLIWVIFRRIFIDKASPTKADKKHIHHRLLELGLSQRNAAIVLYTWVALVGVITFVAQGRVQWVLLGAVVVAFIAFATYLAQRVKSL